MSAIQYLNRGAEVLRKNEAIAFNFGAARDLAEVLKTNLGPKGTLKMLIGGAKDFKLTKDGHVLLKEMQIRHPTAQFIARAATAQDDETGDGSTSAIVIIGETVRQCAPFIDQGIHPQVLNQGLWAARNKALEYLAAGGRIAVDEPSKQREILQSVARTAVGTKVHTALANSLSSIAVDAVLAIHDPVGQPENPVDLNMIETMTMQHKNASDTVLVRGLVTDHAGRHPRMPSRLEKCHILICNIELEYQKTEVQANFVFSTAEERERFVIKEREVVDARVRKIVDLKRQVCQPGENFVVFNQGGIDPISLDMLANDGILGLRRAKRRNMERLTKAAGGEAISDVSELRPEVLGFAGAVYTSSLSEDDKFTFFEDLKDPHSVTILIRGPNKHTIEQIKDAVKDGLNVVRNAILDKAVVAGGGAFEFGCAMHLRKSAHEVEGRARRGYEAFANALLIIPKTLALNCGADPEDLLLQLEDHHREDPSMRVGIDAVAGECMDPVATGILDNYCVKKQLITGVTGIVQNLLLVDEIIRAGRGTAK